MAFTVQFSSNATSKAAAYTDILHQTIETIVKDRELNAYELSSISKFTNLLCGWMDEEAAKRQCSIIIRKEDN